MRSPEIWSTGGYLNIVAIELISSLSSTFLDELSCELLISMSSKLLYFAVLNELDELGESDGSAKIGIQFFQISLFMTHKSY